MRLLGLALVTLIVLIQYPLWLGKGSWLRASEIDRQLQVQRSQNQKLEARNAALAAEVKDLKTGTEAIEERARSEMGMVRADEVFFQFVPDKTSGKPGMAR